MFSALAPSFRAVACAGRDFVLVFSSPSPSRSWVLPALSRSCARSQRAGAGLELPQAAVEVCRPCLQPFDLGLQVRRGEPGVVVHEGNKSVEVRLEVRGTVLQGADALVCVVGPGEQVAGACLHGWWRRRRLRRFPAAMRGPAAASSAVPACRSLLPLDRSADPFLSASTPATRAGAFAARSPRPAASLPLPAARSEEPAAAEEVPAASCLAPSFAAWAPAASCLAPSFAAAAPVASRWEPPLRACAPVLTSAVPAPNVVRPAARSAAPSFRFRAPSSSAAAPPESAWVPARSWEAPSLSAPAPSLAADAPAFQLAGARVELAGGRVDLVGAVDEFVHAGGEFCRAVAEFARSGCRAFCAVGELGGALVQGAGALGQFPGAGVGVPGPVGKLGCARGKFARACRERCGSLCRAARSVDQLGDTVVGLAHALVQGRGAGGHLGGEHRVERDEGYEEQAEQGGDDGMHECVPFGCNMCIQLDSLGCSGGESVAVFGRAEVRRVARTGGNGSGASV